MAGALADWFAARDLMLIDIQWSGEIGLQDVLSSVHNMNRYVSNLTYLLTGRSKTGCNHAVVCREDRIVHDPSINQSGIVGPAIADDGSEAWWVTFFGAKLPL